MTHDSQVRLGFDMLVFNIKQVNLKYIYYYERRMKHNLNKQKNNIH